MAAVPPYETPRYVGFVDLLGYKALALGGGLSPRQRFRYLQSVFEALAQAAHGAAADFDLPSPVRRVQFSDSFYFSSESPVAIVVTMASFFTTAYSLYERTLDQPGEDGDSSFRDWQPFLRGGISYDWMFEGLDVTVPEPRISRDAFRNPIGPAVSTAYLIGEETKTEGMRIVAAPDVAEGFRRELPMIPARSAAGLMAAKLDPLPLKEYRDYGLLHEVPWFEIRLMSDNTVGTFDVLRKAERQFDQYSRKHLRGTYDAILRASGVQASPTLRDRASALRRGVVSQMARENWERRNRPPWDDWHDWFAAEGKIDAAK